LPDHTPTVSALPAHFKRRIAALAPTRKSRFIEGIIRTYILDKSAIIPMNNTRQGGIETEFDGLSFLALSEPEQLKRLDRLECEFGHLRQRFDDRLAFQGLPLIEQYLRGGTAVACYFNRPRGHTGNSHHSTLIEKETAIGHTQILMFQAHSGETFHGGGCDQKMVFVDIVEPTGGPNRRVASVVRHYVVEEFRGQIGEGFLYRSVRGMGFKIVPFFSHREINPVTPFEDFRHQMVKSGSEIVDGIPNDKRNLGWKAGDRTDLEKLLSGFRLLLNGDFAEFRLEEGCKDAFQLLDVAVGPLNL
jgi:hypothetical protein